jgi:hypothetical protein
MTANEHALLSFRSRSFLALSASNGSPLGAFSRQYSSSFATLSALASAAISLFQYAGSSGLARSIVARFCVDN